MALTRSPARPPKPASGKAWEESAPSLGPTDHLDSTAPPTKGLHVRFNEWELAELGRVGDMNQTSKQRIVRRIVRNWLNYAQKKKFKLVSDPSQNGTDDVPEESQEAG